MENFNFYPLWYQPVPVKITDQKRRGFFTKFLAMQFMENFSQIGKKNVHFHVSLY